MRLQFRRPSFAEWAGRRVASMTKEASVQMRAAWEDVSPPEGPAVIRRHPRPPPAEEAEPRHRLQRPSKRSSSRLCAGSSFAMGWPAWDRRRARDRRCTEVRAPHWHSAGCRSPAACRGLPMRRRPLAVRPGTECSEPLPCSAGAATRPSPSRVREDAPPSAVQPRRALGAIPDCWLRGHEGGSGQRAPDARPPPLEPKPSPRRRPCRISTKSGLRLRCDPQVAGAARGTLQRPREFWPRSIPCVLPFGSASPIGRAPADVCHSGCSAGFAMSGHPWWRRCWDQPQRRPPRTRPAWSECPYEWRPSRADACRASAMICICG